MYWKLLSYYILNINLLSYLVSDGASLTLAKGCDEDVNISNSSCTYLGSLYFSQQIRLLYRILDALGAKAIVATSAVLSTNDTITAIEQHVLDFHSLQRVQEKKFGNWEFY